MVTSKRSEERLNTLCASEYDYDISMDSQKQCLATLKAVAGFSDGVVWRIPLNIRNKFSQNNQKVELKSHCSDIINYGAYNRSTNRERAKITCYYLTMFCNIKSLSGILNEFGRTWKIQRTRSLLSLITYKLDRFVCSLVSTFKKRGFCCLYELS